MRVTKVDFPTSKKPTPIIFLGYPLPKETALVGGYLLGSVSGICLMDYLLNLSIKNRVYVEYWNKVIND